MGTPPGPADADYVPNFSPEEVKRLQRWHEDAYQATVDEAGRDGQNMTYLGLDLHVPPQVQPITPVSHLLGEQVLAEVGPGERVLDMGTGCGVNAILAARKGAQVLAVDLNPEAVRAARANAQRNGVMDRIEAREGDVFDPIDPVSDGRFDLVIFDPPFAGSSRATSSRWRRPTRATGRLPASYEKFARIYRSEGGCCCFSGLRATSHTCGA